MFFIYLFYFYTHTHTPNTAALYCLKVTNQLPLNQFFRLLSMLHIENGSAFFVSFFFLTFYSHTLPLYGSMKKYYLLYLFITTLETRTVNSVFPLTERILPHVDIAFWKLVIYLRIQILTETLDTVVLK